MEPSSSVISTTSLKEWKGKPEIGTGWTCAGFIPGEGLLVHSVDPKADRVRAKIGVLRENDVKIKLTESIEGFSKIDPKLISKGVVISVTEDGQFIALAGVRKRIGGYLAIWGKRGPKRQLVHQEKDSGSLTSAPRILGIDKQVRPRAVKISPSGQVVVITTHSYKRRIWKTRNTPQNLESWSGIWLTLQEPSPPSVGSVGDITFPSRTSIFITTATVGSASSGCETFQFWTACEGTPAIHSPSKIGKKSIKKPCLILRQQTITLPDTERGGSIDCKSSEYATPLPVDESWTGQPSAVIQQGISVKWDSESALVAISIGSNGGSRVLFAAPGQSVCQCVSLPIEIAKADEIQWWGSDTLLTCLDSSTGRFCIIPRLGHLPVKIKYSHQEQNTLLISPASQSSVSSMLLSQVKKPHAFRFTAIGKALTTGQRLLISNGASVLRISFTFNCRNTNIEAITASALPQWLGPLSGIMRYLTTQRRHSVKQVKAVCSSVTSCIAAESSSLDQIDSRGITKSIVAALKQYTENITSLWWSVGCLGLACLPIVVVVFHHLTAGVVQLLVHKLVRSVSLSETLQSLDSTYHILKWGEKQFSKMVSFDKKSPKPTVEWYLKGYWVVLYRQVDSIAAKIEKKKGTHLQGFRSLRDAVLSKLKKHCPEEGEPEHPEGILKGHDAYLAGMTEHGIQHYQKADRVDCAFSLRLLEGTVTEIIEHASLSIQSSLQSWDNNIYLVHAPSLRREKCSETRLCDAFSALLTGLLFKQPAYVLPPILCSAISDLVVIGEGNTSYEALSAKVQNEEFRRIMTSFLSPVSVRSSESELLSSLLCELYCITGLPLEALHIALLFRRTASLTHILRILAWHTTGQQSLHGWPDTSSCHIQPASDHRSLFQGYKRCRNFIKETMLAKDETSKLYVETVQDPNNMVRGGWVCSHCMEECLTLFALKSIREGDPIQTQTLLSSAVATPKFRSSVCRVVVQTAREILSQIPIFDPRCSQRGVASPSSLFAQILKQHNGKDEDLSLSPELSSALNGKLPSLSTPPMERIKLVARLLAWALIFLAPSSEPSRCSRSLLKLIAHYKSEYGTPHPDSRQESDNEVTNIFSYLFAAQCWHYVHANSYCGEGTVLGVPDSWRSTGEEQQESHTTKVAAEFSSKLLYWSRDIWRQDEVQRSCLSCLELCSDDDAINIALSKAFYEESTIDCPMTISVSTKGQYNRIKNELPEAMKSSLVPTQKTTFDSYYSQPDSMAQQEVDMDALATRFSFRSKMFEVDATYWEMISSLVTDNIISNIDPPESQVGTEPYTELAYTTALINRAANQSSESSVILPFGTTPVSGVVRALFSKTTSSGEGAGEDQVPTKFTDGNKTVTKKTRSQPVKEYAADSGSKTVVPSKEIIQLTKLKKVAPPTVSTTINSPTLVREGSNAVPVSPGGASPRLVPDASLGIVRQQQQSIPTRDAFLPSQFAGLSEGGMLLEIPPTPPQSSKTIIDELFLRGVRQEDPTQYLPISKTIPPPSCSGTSITQGTTYTESGTTMTSVSPSLSISAPTSSALETPIPVMSKLKRGKKIDGGRIAPLIEPYVGVTPPRRTHKKEKNRLESEHDNRGVKEVHYHYNAKHDHASKRDGHGGNVRTNSNKHCSKHSRGHDCRKCGRKKSEKQARRPTQFHLEPPQKVSDTQVVGLNMRRIQQLGEHQAASMYDQQRKPPHVLQPPDIIPVPTLVKPSIINFDLNRLPGSGVKTVDSTTTNHLPNGFLLDPRVSSVAPQRLSPPNVVNKLDPEIVIPGNKYGGDSPRLTLSPSSPVPPAGVSVALSPMQGGLVSPETLEKQTSCLQRTTVNQPTSPMTPAIAESSDVEGIVKKTLSGVFTNAPEGLPPVPPAATPVTPGIGSPLQSPGSSLASPHFSQTLGNTAASVNLGPASSFRSQADAIIQQQAPTTAVGQPVLSSMEELMYAKYISELGITSVDAVITSSAAPLIKHVVQKSEPVEDINAKHAAIIEMEERNKQLATIGRDIPVSNQPATTTTTTTQPSSEPSDPTDGKSQAKLEDLLSRMLDRQESVAANVGKELAAAFTESLKVCVFLYSLVRRIS